uniref:Putative conjugative transfer protein n=1 Tax=Vibrio harveyi TaxID=669 RepID=E5G5K3_VIBHA|nr:putative conjugative transfer protein [Vibrio harveyi]
MTQRHFPLLLCCLLVFITPSTLAASAACKSRFINPISDICWDCLFPMTIGSATVMTSKYPDTHNPSMPISYCPKPPPVFMQIGVTLAMGALRLNGCDTRSIMHGKHGKQMSAQTVKNWRTCPSETADSSECVYPRMCKYRYLLAHYAFAGMPAWRNRPNVLLKVSLHSHTRPDSTGA